MPDELLTVYDGTNLWAYNPKSNEYRVYVVPNLPRDSRPEDTDLYMGIGPYRHATEVWGSPKLLSEEKISFAGGTAECFVLQAVQGSESMKLWIDKHNFPCPAFGRT